MISVNARSRHNLVSARRRGAPAITSGSGGTASTDQMSIFFEISIASSTAMPRHLTVLWIFEGDVEREELVEEVGFAIATGIEDAVERIGLPLSIEQAKNGRASAECAVRARLPRNLPPSSRLINAAPVCLRRTHQRHPRQSGENSLVPGSRRSVLFLGRDPRTRRWASKILAQRERLRQGRWKYQQSEEETHGLPSSH